MSSRGSAQEEGGERRILDRIRRRLPPPPASLVVAPGDDAAVAVPERGAYQVLTTDALVEGIHFDRRFSSLADIGYKAVAVNVSDIAAMGGTASLALLSLILPAGLSEQDIDALLDGVLEMAGIAGVTIAGGNLARSPGPLVVDVTITGHVRPRKVLTRSGGKPGDSIFVTGAIGTAAAGLAWLREHAGTQPDDAGLADCVQRHRRPEPRSRLGALLGRTKTASACMDLSDGLADAVSQIAESSGTGAAIDASALPVHPAAEKWFREHALDPVLASVAGGDDYELLFTVPRKASGGKLRALRSSARGVPITRIGELTKEPEVVLMRDGRPAGLPPGFSHF